MHLLTYIYTDNKVENKPFDSVPTTQSLPIVGDRYSLILSDVQVSECPVNDFHHKKRFLTPLQQKAF